jgi:hypothetical protein
MNKFQFKSGKDIDGGGQTNTVRAVRAELALREAYKMQIKSGLKSYNAADLVGDIFHLCDRNKWDANEVIQLAIGYWMEER